MIVVSACLAGDNCTHRGTNNLVSEIKRLVNKRQAVKICPEVLGGLPVPRDYGEIIGGEGVDVINGTAKVLNKDGTDLTNAFLKGARAAYKVIKNLSVELAIFKSNSPSCGCGEIYDGTFSSGLKKGDGVTTAFFKQKGIKVIAEKEYVEGRDGRLHIL